MRIGIYGGTFSPVHIGHVQAAKAFMEQMWLDVLFVIPTGVTPHKEMDNGASDADRLQMCKLAFEGIDGVIVSDVEMLRHGKSYTVDTLRMFSVNSEDRLFLLCGTDMMLSLDTWREPEEIFKLCYPVYIRRESDSSLDKKIIDKIAEYKQKYGKNVVKLTVVPIEVSSSGIRESIKAGEDVSHLLPQGIYEYIKEKGLYLT
ncbi:MAG: nicotinate (nicotinamide) nucleotide adenylyltransferase [Ruminococcaceae bacterium]|nr:nicotinate (nicotinamide) nucleotide adenylyltransferase [Oscillospiraceae bacterium]